MVKKTEVKKKLSSPKKTKPCFECRFLWLVLVIVGALLGGHIISTIDYFKQTSEQIQTIQELLRTNNTLIRDNIEKPRKYKADTGPGPIHQPR